MVEEMGDLGLIAPDLPEKFGGLGVPGVTAGIITEEIAYGDHSVSYIQLLTMLCGGVVAEFAQEEVANEYLPKFINGTKLIGLGLTEPRGGTDAANLILRARRDGDSFVLNGEKASISAAAQADYLVVAARTGTEDQGARGVTAFLVDMHLPGISRAAYNDLGSKAVGRGSVWFEDVRVPAHMMVGDEGAGFTQVMRGFDYSRALIGHMCLGPAQASRGRTRRAAIRIMVSAPRYSARKALPMPASSAFGLPSITCGWRRLLTMHHGPAAEPASLPAPPGAAASCALCPAARPCSSMSRSSRRS